MSLTLPEVARFSRKLMSPCPHQYESESCVGRLQPTFRKLDAASKRVTIEHLVCSHCGALFLTELAGKDLEAYIKSQVKMDDAPFGNQSANCSNHPNAPVGVCKHEPYTHRDNGRVFDRQAILHFCTSCLSIIAFNHSDYERLPSRYRVVREA